MKNLEYSCFTKLGEKNRYTKLERNICFIYEKEIRDERDNKNQNIMNKVINEIIIKER